MATLILGMKTVNLTNKDMPEKPAFDPNKPFNEPVIKDTTKPAFNPNKGFMPIENKQPDTQQAYLDAFQGKTQVKKDEKIAKVFGDKPDETSFGGELFNSLAKGSAKLGEMLAKTPSMIYDIAAIPFNYVASGQFKEDLQPLPNMTESMRQEAAKNPTFTSEKFAESMGNSFDGLFKENKIAKYYNEDVKVRQQQTAQKYDKGISEYFSNGEYKKGFGLLANSVAESAPVTISLLMGNAAGIPTAGSILGGGTVFAADKKAELDEQAPDLDQQTKMNIAMSNGLFEGLFEQFGITKLGGLTKDVLLRSGKEEAKKIAAEGFKETYTPVLKKYLGTSAEESISEAATQFAQNAVDKYSGYKPDLDLKEGVVDAAIIGLAAGAATSAVPSLIEASKNKSTSKEVANIQKANIEKENERSRYAFEVSKKGEEGVNEFVNGVEADFADGNLTREQADNAIVKVKTYSDYQKQTEDLNLDDEDKRKMFDFTFQKSNLIDQLKAVDKEKLNGIELAKYHGIEKQAKDLQANIDDIVLKAQLQDETTVADTTIDKEVKDRQPLPKTEKKLILSPDVEELMAHKDKYEKEILEAKNKSTNKLENLKYEDISVAEFNSEKFNARVKHAKLADYLETIPDKKLAGKLVEKKYTYNNKQNSTYAVQLPDGKVIKLASSMERPEKFRGHMRTEHLIDAKDLVGFPVGVKVEYLPEGKKVIKLYNGKTGKFISWAKETNRGLAKPSEMQIEQLSHLETVNEPPISGDATPVTETPLQPNPNLDVQANNENTEESTVNRTESTKGDNNQVVPKVINKAKTLVRGTKKANRKIKHKGMLKALKTEVFTPHELAMQYFIGGGELNPESVRKLFKGSKGEMSARISYLRKNGNTIEQIAEKIVNDNESLQLDMQDVVNAVEDVVNGYNSSSAMASAINAANDIGGQELNESEIEMEQGSELADEMGIGDEINNAIDVIEGLSDEEIIALSESQEKTDDLIDKNITKISKRAYIESLRSRKNDKAIHADIYQYDGYNVNIFDNEGIIQSKKFKTDEEANAFLNDWIKENAAKNREKYDYGTIQDIANLPHRLEAFGDLPNIGDETNESDIIGDDGEGDQFQKIEDDYSYRMGHQIRKDESSSTLDDLLKNDIAPSDIYTGMKYYADLTKKDYQESAKVINQVKGKPDAMVTIYRAVPKGVTKINKGDWVTLSKTYAKHHGMHHEDSKLDMPVISMKVKASDVVWDANDINEFAYIPEEEQQQRQKGGKGNVEVEHHEKVLKVIAAMQKALPNIEFKYNKKLKAAGVLRASGKTIEINPYYAGLDTPIHEAGHVLIDAMGYDNQVIQAAFKQLKNTKLADETKQRYPELSEEMLNKEILAEAIGREGADIFDTEAEKSRFKQLLDYIFTWFKNKLGLNKNVAKSLAKQIIGGIGTKDIGGTQSTTDQEGKVSTTSDKFKKWFKDSKVVNKDGSPKVVYHGTGSKFSKFNLKKATQGIAWFTSEKSDIESGEVGAQGKGHIMDLYASIQNPAGWNEYEKYGLGQLQSMGYDGVILPEKDGKFVGFVFDANQLKSINNKGEFSTENDNIYYQKESSLSGDDFNKFREKQLGRNVADEEQRLDKIDALLKKEEISDSDKEALEDIKSSILELQELDKDAYDQYLGDKKDIEKVIKADNLEDFTLEKLIEVYEQAKGYTDDTDIGINEVRLKIGNYINKQGKERLKKFDKAIDEQANKRDLKWREVWFRTLSHMTQEFPELQELSKMFDTAYLEMQQDRNAKKGELEKLGKAVIAERNKKMGIAKTALNYFSSNNAKYFEFLNENGKLRTNTAGLSEAQIKMLNFMKKLTKDRAKQYDENDELIDNELIKIDRGVIETYKESGLLEALSNYMGGVDNLDVQITYKNPNTKKEEKTTYQNAQKQILEYAKKDGGHKAEALAKLVSIAYKAKKAGNVSEYSLNYNGQLTSKFDSPYREESRLTKEISELKEKRKEKGAKVEEIDKKIKEKEALKEYNKTKGFSKDFYKAAMSYIDDETHVTHLGKLIPIIDSIEFLNEKGFNEDKPNVRKFLQEWKGEQIYKAQKTTDPIIDNLAKFFRVFTSQIVMGFNYPAAVMNIVMGNYNNWRAEGVNLNWDNGNVRLFKNPRKSAAILKKYNILESDFDSNPKLFAGKFFDMLAYGAQRYGEYQIQGSMFLGQITKDEWNSFEYDTKAKELKLKKGADEKALKEKFNQYKNKISDIQGKYSEKDRRNFMRFEAGKASIQFKVWAIDWLKERFGGKYIDANNVVHEGSWRALSLKSLADTKKIFKEKGFEEGAKSVWNDKRVRQDVKGMMAIALLLILKYSNDDDEKKRRSALSLNNALGNMFFLFDPEQAKYTLKNAVPGVGTLIKFIEAFEAMVKQDGTVKKKVKKIIPYNKTVDVAEKAIDLVEGKK